MNKIYEKQTWHNDSAPALSEDNLNHIENGIDAIDTRLAGLAPADIGAVPNTRTVNGHALNENVSLSASDVGLGNVPNVTTNNQTPTFNEASARANINSGETVATLFGKIKKWFSDLGDLVSNLGDLAFLNKDGASSTKFLRGDGTWQNVGGGGGDVTGVKGNAETNYRTGNVNLTPANLGITNETAFIEPNNFYGITCSSAGKYALLKYKGNGEFILGLTLMQNSTLIAKGLLHVVQVGYHASITFEGSQGASAQNIFSQFLACENPNAAEDDPNMALCIKAEASGTISYIPLYIKGDYVEYGTTSTSVAAFTRVMNSCLIDDADLITGNLLAYFLDLRDGLKIMGYNDDGVYTDMVAIQNDGSAYGDGVDTHPTEDSDRLVRSGGVHQALTDGSVTKIGTGTVGSATQPVYINGGVPRAVNYNINVVSQANSTIETLVTQIKTKALTLSPGAYSFFGSWNSHSYGYQAAAVKGEESATFWKVSGTVYEYVHGRVWTFIDTYNPTTQAWSGVKIRQISGISTGTPTNPATGLTLQDSQFEKSGNVVVFRVVYKCTSNVTLTGGFAVCTLPWTPAYVTRVTRIVGDTNDSHTQNISYGTLKTDKKLYGGPNDAQSTTGNYIEYYGTYLTND